MSWHVRFFSPSLEQDVMSSELASEAAALEEAWKLAQNGEAVTAIEGPDGELVSAEEIEDWFRKRELEPGLRPKAERRSLPICLPGDGYETPRS